MEIDRTLAHGDEMFDLGFDAGVTSALDAIKAMRRELPLSVHAEVGSLDSHPGRRVSVLLHVVIDNAPERGSRQLREVLDALDESPTILHSAVGGTVVLRVAHPLGVYHVVTWPFVCSAAGLHIDEPHEAA